MMEWNGAENKIKLPNETYKIIKTENGVVHTEQIGLSSTLSCWLKRKTSVPDQRHNTIASGKLKETEIDQMYEINEEIKFVSEHFVLDMNIVWRIND